MRTIAEMETLPVQDEVFAQEQRQSTRYWAGHLNRYLNLKLNPLNNRSIDYVVLLSSRIKCFESMPLYHTLVSSIHLQKNCPELTQYFPPKSKYAMCHD